MDLIQICGIGLISAILSITIKKNNPEISLTISIVGGVIILIILLSKLLYIIPMIKDFVEKAQLDTSYITGMLKIVGIAYVSEFAAQICRDAGENAIAQKVELGGRLLILLLSIPILFSIFNMIIGLVKDTL